ncbi:DUF3426 domain-containing protein [Oceanospirillum sanctuarii]|uniref:DUF3426 domain-containing protein n=1 Tax=Oceanospirillum sanctuarii TaxID=1434821 RepID=UPI000A3A6BF0|nr:DUF3426 domain-containing protein [Oceanospirillum sanctuarii]
MMDDRLTRCPHCSTCFAVSDADLQQAFGVARCGRCKKIFNAANHLFELEADESSSPVESLQPLSSEQSQALAQSQKSASEQETHSVGKSEAISTSIPADTDSDTPDLSAYSSDVAVTAETETKLASQSEKAPAPQKPAEIKPEAEQAPEAKKVPATKKVPENAEDFLQMLPDTPDMMLDDEDLSDIRQARLAPELRHHQLEVSLSANRNEEAPDFAPDLHFGAEPDNDHVEQKPKESTPTKAATGLPWIPATLAASLILLILVLLWGNTRTLSESPGLSGFAEAICGLSSCDHYLPSDFEELKASQLAIFEINNQLTAELVLNNPTANPLPFPAILLELRDRSGKIIAEVLYQPDSYLKGKPFADHILPPELPVALSFPIQAKVSDIENLSVRYYPAAEL